MSRRRLSSDTLFHFTSRIEHLLNILSVEFQPHYSLEDLSVLGRYAVGGPEHAVAMVSFCDILLSQTTTHMETYGSYAIGLRKAWGIKKGVTPVLYAHARAAITQELDAAFTRSIRGERGGDQSTIQLLGLRIASLVKSYEGEVKRDGRTATVRFYDEREWRYVPDLIAKLQHPFLTTEEYYNVEERKQAEANLVSDYTLGFEPSDVRYLIVRKEAEIVPLIDSIQGIKAKYELDDVRLLSSRIISAEQIKADF